MPADETRPVPDHESYINGERLYDSFMDGLKLVAAVEKKYACKWMGVEPDKLKDVESNFSFEELSTMTTVLTDIYHDDGDMSSRHDAFMNKAIAFNMVPHEDRYDILKDPEVLKVCKDLVRAGLLSEITQCRVDSAKVQQHHHRNGRSHGQVASTGLGRTLSKAAAVDDLIDFNHETRDFVDSPLGRRMNLDREKMREIIKELLLGDVEQAWAREDGIALELAAKRLMERELAPSFGDDAAVFGDKRQDKLGGDVILFAGTEHEVYVNLKSSVPGELRDSLTEEEAKNSGFGWKGHRRAFLWLGVDDSVGVRYSLPADFVDATRQLMLEAQPRELAIA